MALTIDQLLAQDISSDEEGDAASPTSRPVEASKLRPSATSASGAVPSRAGPRPTLTVEQALAQADPSDDEDEDECVGSIAAPAQQQAAAQPTKSAATPDSSVVATSAAAPVKSGEGVRDEGAGAEDGHRTDAMLEQSKRPGAEMNRLDEILAMNDSSDEEGGAVGASATSALASAARGPREGGGSDSLDASASAVADRAHALSLDKMSFMNAPFDWCRDHERALLRSAENLQDPDGNLASGCETVAGADFTLIDKRPNPDVQRILQQEGGLVTCVASHAKYVGIGSLRGAVVLIDFAANPAASAAQQCSVLHAPGSGDDVTPVTALAFSLDGSSLLVGHKSGQLVLWDLATAKATAVAKDAHSCAVVSVAFCRSDWKNALSADANGSVILLNFTSTFGRRECKQQLLLEKSSSVGATLRILPLPCTGVYENTSVADRCLVALCATRATVLLSLHPTLNLLQKMQYHTKKDVDSKGGDSHIPDAAWLVPDSQESAGASAEPLLCVAFGQTVHTMRVRFEADAAKSKEEFKVTVQHRYIWSVPIVSISALNDGVLVILDNASKLNVVQLATPDDSSGTGRAQLRLAAVHSDDVSNWSIAYHTHVSKDAGREVRSYHGALAVWRGHRRRSLFVVGVREVWNLQVRRWGQHVEELVNKDRLPDALEVFLALRRGDLPPLLDFPQAPESRKKAVDLRATQVIQSYLSSRLQQDTPRARTRSMCHTAVSACVEMGLWSVLYKTVFECFKASGHMNVYCSVLEPFIVNGKIPRGQMDSEVLSSIVQSYALPLEEEEQLALQRLRECAAQDSDRAAPAFASCDDNPELFPAARRLQQLVLHVDVAQLDLNLAIRLFTQHRLWTALLCLYCALGDYASPMELLLGECQELARRRLQQASDDPKAPEIESHMMQCRCVRKLFYFLKRCCQLRAFPLDASDFAGVADPKPDGVTGLLRCMFKPDAGAEGGSRAPPVFLKLLRLSPFGLFEALTALYTTEPTCFELLRRHSGETATYKALTSHQVLSPSGFFRVVESAVQAAKRQADLPENVDSELLWFTASAAPRADVALPAPQLAGVVDCLLEASSSSRLPRLDHRSALEAESRLIELLGAQREIDEQWRLKLINTTAQRGMLRVTSFLHEQRGEYAQALDSRMRDSELAAGIFDYIVQRLTVEAGQNGGGRSASLVEATMQRLPKLVAMDAERCAEMVCEHLANVADHDGVLERLRARGYPQIEMKYLETLLIERRRSHWKRSEDQQAFFDRHVVRYIELLCSISPAAVLPFLQENEALPLNECLELCRAHAVTDGSMYLLERTGDFVGVLDLMLGDFAGALEKLQQSLQEPRSEDRTVVTRAMKRLLALKTDARTDDGPRADTFEARSKASGTSCPTSGKADEPWWEGFQDAQRCVDLIDRAFELSSRNSNLMTPDQLEDLWFGILGRTVRCQEAAAADEANTARKRASLVAAFADLASRAMTGVLAYLSLPRALNWICEQFGPAALGIWKDSLHRMLSGLEFQQGLLRAAKAVAARDAVVPFVALKARGSRGVRLNAGQCSAVVGAIHGRGAAAATASRLLAGASSSARRAGGAAAGAASGSANAPGSGARGEAFARD